MNETKHYLLCLVLNDAMFGIGIVIAVELMNFNTHQRRIRTNTHTHTHIKHQRKIKTFFKKDVPLSSHM